MVLVRHRSAEQRHDAVAHDLAYRAVVAVDGLDHRPHRRLELGQRLFGIQPGDHRRRAANVGEQDRDELYLPVERRLGLLQPAVDAARWTDRPVRPRGAGDDLAAAAAAEPVVGAVLETAAGTGRRKRIAALGAEFSPSGVGGLALEAIHGPRPFHF